MMGTVFTLTMTTIHNFYLVEILEYLQEHHFDAALAVLFVACAVYYSREELYSQGRFTWTNMGLEFTWTELGLGILIECVLLVLHYIAGFSLQGGFIWNTCCLLIGLVLCVFIVAKSIKVMLPSQNETQKSEDRSASQKENKMQSPGQSYARGTNNGRTFHRTILNECLTELLHNLDLRAVYPYIVVKDLFDDLTRRDILDQKTSNDKIQYLIDRLKERDDVTYEKFKECLVQSNQAYLKDMLEIKEQEVKDKMLKTAL